MALDYDRVKNWPLPEIRQKLEPKDTMLYALGLGLGADPLDAKQLRFVYEENLLALPTMADVLAPLGFWMKNPYVGVDWKKLLHGEQGFVLHKPIPAQGEVIGRSRIAERAGLMLAPHAGELLGAQSVRTCLESLGANRLGHGIRASEDPALLDEIATRGITLEVCPVSNVSLGVYSDLSSVPLPQLMEAGVGVALGSDDPLLFGARLASQYATMRAAHELTDSQLADLAKSSIHGSTASESAKVGWLQAIDQWLTADPHEPLATSLAHL